MENKKESFTYNYSAKEQEEIRSIREKYQSKTEDKMEQLRKLDASVTKKGTIISLAVGIIGCLVFGGGMSIVMVMDVRWFAVGIILGIIGIVGIALAHPLYMSITKRERERVAPEILRLTEELMK